MAQLPSPCGLYMPAGHALQYLPPSDTPEPSLSSLVKAVKYPPMQVMQLDAGPALGWYFPVWQELQLLPFLYSPAAQFVGVQLLAPA